MLKNVKITNKSINKISKMNKINKIKLQKKELENELR